MKIETITINACGELEGEWSHITGIGETEVKNALNKIIIGARQINAYKRDGRAMVDDCQSEGCFVAVVD